MHTIGLAAYLKFPIVGNPGAMGIDPAVFTALRPVNLINA
jgi:hypothetical protein